jgi:RND family efflux transporter MFP subunit
MTDRIEREQGNLFMKRIRRLPVAVVALAGVTLTACGGGGGGAAAEPTETAIEVTADNIIVVDSVQIQSGPSISGSLQPEKSSQIRAEVGGPVLQTYAERGQTVSRGTLLARIDDTAIRDSYLSARSAQRTAEQAATVARRNTERSQKLADAGAVAERELENARVSQSSAEAQLADATARLAAAQKLLNATQVRSPINGVVSDRAVSGGDVVQPGAALFTVVDPGSMQLKAAVPASQLGALHTGAPVEFKVNGYPNRVFTGEIERVDPVADVATGQVGITATIPNMTGTLVGGLFAEGRVTAESRRALAVPLNAVDMTGGTASVLRLQEGIAQRTPVTLGLRDEQAERVEIASGVAAGDTLLVGPAMSTTPGTPVRVQTLSDVGTVRR